MSLRWSYPSVLLMAGALVAGPGRVPARAAPVTAADLAQFFGVSESSLDAPKVWAGPGSHSRTVVEGSGLLSPVFTVPVTQPPEYLFLSFQVQLLSDQPQCDPANCPGRDSVFAVLERVGTATSVFEVLSTANTMTAPLGRFGYDRGTSVTIGLGWSGFTTGDSYRIGFAVVDGDDPGGNSGVVVDNIELRRLSCPNNVCGPNYDVVWGQYFEQGWGSWSAIGTAAIEGCASDQCAAVLRTDGGAHPPLDPGGDGTVPEPSTLALAGLGLAGAIARRTARR